jgi:hypothetical protein
MALGQILNSTIPYQAGTNKLAVDAPRAWVNAGLARRPIVNQEFEVTAGAAAGATLATDAGNTLVPGDFFDLTHAGHAKAFRFFFTGVGVKATSAFAAPAQTNVTAASDWIIITDPDGVVTVLWFDKSGSDTVPAAVTALVAAGESGSAAVEVAIDSATTDADVVAAIESALNTAAIGITSDDGAADGTAVWTVDARGAGGNDWTISHTGAHGDWVTNNPTGGVADVDPLTAVNQSTHYGIPVVVAAADSDDADAVAVDIAAAINGAQDWIRANYGDTSFVSGMPTAADGTAIVTMATFVNEVNDVNAAWTWVEAIADSTFVAVQGSSVDVFIGEVSVTNGPVQYTTDDPGTVAVLIVAANANAISHSVYAAQGTNSSHIRLTQRRSGALGVLSAG